MPSPSRTVQLLSLLLAMAVVVVDAGAILGQQRPDKENPSSRGVHFANESGRKCDVFWVNTFQTPESFVPQFIEDGVSVGLPYGASKALSSYIGHTFEVREQPSRKAGPGKGKCAFSECRKVRYTMSDRRDQKVIINKDFTLTTRDDRERVYTKATDMFTKCQEKVAESGNLSALESIELVAACMEEEMEGKVDFDRKERSFHSKVHRQMAVELVPFTCANVNGTQSSEIKNATWTYNGDEGEKSYKIRRLHHLPTSEIFVVDNFISSEACDALKIYKQRSNTGNGIGIPMDAAVEQTKQGEMLMNVFYKMYQLLIDRFPNWKELNFNSEFLFEYIKDPVGFKTPSHLCVTQEDVDEVVAAIAAGKPKKCLIPGGVPESAPTKHVVVEEGMSNDDKNQKRQLAQMFLFCDEPKDQLGALHFPYAAVHTTPKPGKLVVAVHRHEGDEDHGFDGYANEYHLCPNHEVYVHTVFDHDPPEFVPPGDDEGEL